MTSQLNSTQKDALKDQIKQQLMIASFKEILSSMTEKCFNKCVAKPNDSLDSGETKCINLCVDRFMESRNLITHSFVRAAKTAQDGLADF